MSRFLLDRPTDVSRTPWPAATDFQIRVDDPHAPASQAVVRLCGELDLATSPMLAHCLSDVLDGRPPTVVVNLARLTFIDSTGVRVLVDAYRRAESCRCAFILDSPTRPVLKTLRLTGVDGLMRIDGSSQGMHPAS